MFIKTDVWTVGRTENGMATLLRLPSSTRCVPIYVKDFEAQTILASLSGISEKPPSFSDLLVSLGKAVAVQLETVEILRGDTPRQYRAMIHFSGNNKRFSLEARTPDALAIALRCGTPIFLEDIIAEKDSISVSLSESDTPFSAQLARLKGELQQRVEAEDYEEAIAIQDRIKQIEKRMQSE